MNGAMLSAPNRVVAPEKRGMSMIFQSYAIWPNMTVAQNVAFGLKLRKLPADQLNTRLDRILDVVQLRHLKDRYPAELSGGQQQRVALARAIVIEPEVLLLDEPLSNLDANLREEMRSEIRRLHDAFRITTVYVTHDQSEAMVTSDRIVVMNHGRIEQVDDPVSLYNRPKTRFVAGFIGRTNFLDGTVNGGLIGFPGFSVPAALAPDADGVNGPVSYSVRPQTIAIHRTAPADRNGGWWVEGRIAERAYLGEYWEYVVRPAEADLRLRVSASPQTVYDTGDAVWLEIDPRRAARVPSEE
jgi:iron(III) transport system ATP-binding protein